MRGIIVIFFLTFSLSSFAQDFAIGPKVGVSQGNIKVNGEGFTTGDSKMGYHLGAFVRMGGQFIFIQPEFLYTSTGGSIVQQNDNGTDLNLNAQFNRLDIPFMVGLKLASVFRIQAGPIASVLLDYELKDALQAAQQVDYSSANLGYQAGIGLDIGNLILDFKYENSLGKIAKSVGSFNTDQRQSMLMISAGFRLF
jgi:hypothetical protein